MRSVRQKRSSKSVPWRSAYERWRQQWRCSGSRRYTRPTARPGLLTPVSMPLSRNKRHNGWRFPARDRSKVPFSTHTEGRMRALRRMVGRNAVRPRMTRRSSPAIAARPFHREPLRTSGRTVESPTRVGAAAYHPLFSNAIKRHNNLLYCYSCGYDVDHDGYGCTNPKVHHVPSVTRAMAHTVPRASMKAQHKTLPDGTGAGMGWILSESIGKAAYVREGKGGPQKYSDSFVGPPQWKNQKGGKGNGDQQM